MTLSNADFIDGNPFYVPQSGALEATCQMPFEDVFNGVPSDFQMVGNIGNGHAAAQSQNVPLKGAGVGAARICKPQLYLADGIAAHALHPLNGQFNEYRR